ncbi:MAG: hypothetical protein IJ693_05005 [Bacteroidaceae bacterium]|nr:hypothetical protein [Bacteroidaceae bacterium]
MKKLFFLLMLLAAGMNAKAQQLDVSVKTYGEGGAVTVIKPTIANLLTLLSFNEAQFEQVMKDNHYEGRKMGDDYIAYWNGSNDNFAYAKCVNAFLYNLKEKEVHFSVGTEMVYPQGSIASLYHELRPYYKETTYENRSQFGRGPGQRGPEGRRPDGRGPRGRGFGGGSRTDVYELSDDGGTYTISIGAYPRFFYIVVGKEK